MAELKDLVFIDCETSGLDPLKDEILELALIRVDVKTLERKADFHAYFKPTWPVPPEVAAINGYDEAKWKEYGALELDTPEYDVAMNRITELLTDATLAGQNPSFDKAFLREEYNFVNRPFPNMDYHLVDVATLAWPLFVAGLIPGVSLRHTRKLFGLAGEQHRAMSDVLDALEVYRHLMGFYTATVHTDIMAMHGSIFEPRLEREATKTLSCSEDAAYAIGLVREDRMDKLYEYLKLEESRVSVLRGLGLDVLASSPGDLDAVIELVASHARNTNQ